ncbi:MAG: CDP-diacylglycerol--serine O-phosphatidyltransferase [Acidobacteriota bacterium]
MRRRRLAGRRTIYLIPSLFTVGNIFAGFFAVISVLQGNFEHAAVAIGLAVVLDGLDGRIARMTGATSEFGLQLDSLADVISFGIAPSILIYSWGFGELGNFARLSAFVFLICGAMRLARFNIQVEELRYFVGLPIPAGAGMIAALVHFVKVPPEQPAIQVGLAGLTYLLAFLMISTIRYPSPKQLQLARGKSHVTVLVVGLLLAGIVWYSEQVLIALATIYVLSGPGVRIYHWMSHRSRRRSEAWVAPPVDLD